METIRSLQNVSATFVNNATKEVLFVNGIAKVEDSVAKELLSRPGRQYVKETEFTAKVIDPSQVSIEQLNGVFNGLVVQGRLPELKKFLREKLSDIEPVLMTMQQKGKAMPKVEPVPEPEVISEKMSPGEAEGLGVDGSIETPEGKFKLTGDLSALKKNTGEANVEEDPGEPKGLDYKVQKIARKKALRMAKKLKKEQHSLKLKKEQHSL